MINEEIKPVSVITAKKKDQYTIEITETKEPVTTIKEYDVNFLQKQLKDIQAQKDAFVALRNTEIDNLKFLIAEAKRLNVIEKSGN